MANLKATDFAFFDDDECIDNDEYPSDQEALASINVALKEVDAFRRGEVTLRTSTPGHSVDTDVALIEMQSNNKANRTAMALMKTRGKKLKQKLS